MAPYFSLFGRQIPLYGVFFYLGIITAAAVAMLICKRRSIPRFEIAYSGVYTMIGAIVGAKLLFIAVSLRQIIEENIPVEAVIKGGFVFYGGVIGGILGLLVYAKQFHMSIAPFCEIYAVVLPLGHAFGRIGCFFAGCCYGIPYDGLFSNTYHISIGNTPLGISLFPVQLLESACLFVLFVLLLTVYFKNKHQYGMTVMIYLILYPVLRFFVEFLRGDSERGHFLKLSVSQWISLAVFIMSITYLIHRRKEKKHRHRTIQHI